MICHDLVLNLSMLQGCPSSWKFGVDTIGKSDKYYGGKRWVDFM